VRATVAFATASLLATAVAIPAAGQEQVAEPVGIEASIWFDRGYEPVLQQGERVRVYFRAEEDAYAAIFQIDTDGRARMVFPRDPRQNNYIRGGRDYRLLLRNSEYWYVDDLPGVGYFFIVASERPLDFSDFRFSTFEQEWDLRQVGADVYRDPYLAMDDYVARLIPNWETAWYGLDVAEYDVGADHEYPRFMCYQCHAWRPYRIWNPYFAACTSFQLVIWSDPYAYPAYRFRADRVVYTRPRATEPRFEFKERPEGERGAAVIQRRPPNDTPRRRTEVDAGPGGSLSPPVATGRPGVVTSPRRGERDDVESFGRSRPTVRVSPTVDRPPGTRPTGVPPTRSGRGEEADAARRGEPADPPILQRRAPSEGAGGTDASRRGDLRPRDGATRPRIQPLSGRGRAPTGPRPGVTRRPTRDDGLEPGASGTAGSRGIAGRILRRLRPESSSPDQGTPRPSRGLSGSVRSGWPGSRSGTARPSTPGGGARVQIPRASGSVRPNATRGSGVSSPGARSRVRVTPPRRNPAATRPPVRRPSGNGSSKPAKSGARRRGGAQDASP
jgi:hypothetical protein